MKKRIEARHLLTLGLLGVSSILLSCGSGTEPVVENPVHGGPDHPAEDGSYTEAITSPDGIASLETVTLGGVQQWLLIRGQDTSNPVLIFLHGGPGSPAIGYARFAFKPLEEHFTVVTWDQRGCGKSYSAAVDPQSLTYSQLLSDAHELVLQMRSRFGADKVFLMGISWGAILGAHLAAAYPDLFYAYVGIGQPVNVSRGLGIALDLAIEQTTASGDQELLAQFTALQELWQTDPDQAWDQAGPLESWLELNGYGDLHDLSLYSSLAREAGPTTEYTAQDQANENSWQALYDASPLRQDASWLLAMDLPADIPELQVPAVFLNGAYDYKSPLQLVDEYVNGLVDPAGKRLVTFSQSGHAVFLEERTLFRNTMINTVAPYGN